MITYTLTDGWAAFDPTLPNPALIEQTLSADLTGEELSAIINAVSSGSAVEPDPTDVAELDALHDSIRPNVPEGGTYQVIELDAHRNSAGEWLGILNCRVDGEHVQVRF